MFPLQLSTTGLRRIQPAHVGAIFHDRSSAQKAHARDHVGDHLRRRWSYRQPQIHKRCRAEANQRVGSQSRRALAPLALRADAGAEYQRQQKTRKAGLIDEGCRVGPPVQPWVSHRAIGKAFSWETSLVLEFSFGKNDTPAPPRFILELHSRLTIPFMAMER